MKLFYRKATSQDIYAINILISDAIGQMESMGIMQWDELYPTQEDFMRDMEAEQLYVGYDENTLAVVYVLNRQFDEAYKRGKWEDETKSFYILHRLCVNPKYQNKGVAKMTMEHIEREVKKKGIDAIRLDVFTENPYALKLYNKCGYKNVGKVTWRKGDFYLMEKYI